MKNISNMKKFTLVLAIILPLLVIVVIKTLNTDRFRKDASKWAAPSMSESVVLTGEQLQTLSGRTMVVNLNDVEISVPGAAETLDIPAKSLLNKEVLKKLRAHKGNILLASDDPALSARMWMLLSQMGYKHLYILADGADNEVLKYTFRPDSSSGPELH
jgi:hypothetical protein